MNEELVTYTLIVNQQLIVVEHVPARVDPQTGERFFRPDVVEQLQQLVWHPRSPHRIIRTPVFGFAATERVRD